jgi:type IV secretion system protein VirB9
VNHLFLKPKAERADTNLTVITDKRVYHFTLVLSNRKPSDPEAWRDRDLTYSLSFRYPDEVARQREAEAAAATHVQKEDEIATRLAAAKTRTDGTDYWIAGAEEVSPSSVRDDGRFMYLTFANNRDMPAVYTEDIAGNEAIVNTHIEGNQIVVQRLFRKLVLRKGPAVACLVNKSFDLGNGTDNTTGTVANDVVRTIKGEKR